MNHIFVKRVYLTEMVYRASQNDDYINDNINAHFLKNNAVNVVIISWACMLLSMSHIFVKRVYHTLQNLDYINCIIISHVHKNNAVNVTIILWTYMHYYEWVTFCQKGIPGITKSCLL